MRVKVTRRPNQNPKQQKKQKKFGLQWAAVPGIAGLEVAVRPDTTMRSIDYLVYI